MHEFSKPLTAGAAAAAIAVGGGMVNAQSPTPSGAVAIGDSGYYVGAQIDAVALRLQAPRSLRIIGTGLGTNSTSSTRTLHSEDATLQGFSLFVGQSFATSENLFVGYEAGFMLPGERFDSDIVLTETCDNPNRPLYYFSGIVDGGELAQAWWGQVRGGFTRDNLSLYGFAGLGSYEVDVEGVSSVRTNCGAVVSAPSTTISDTSFEVGFGGHLLFDERILLRGEVTVFEFDVYDGARVGLGAGIRF